jgi:hypothetical protein
MVKALELLCLGPVALLHTKEAEPQPSVDRTPSRQLLQITRQLMQLIGKANLCRFRILGLNALSALPTAWLVIRDVRCLGRSGLPNAERSRSF